MYIAICDDQQEELAAVASLLTSWQETHQVPLRFKTFLNATELLDAAKKEQFSLYLLDVMMPGTDGIAAAKEIRTFDDTAEIVFLTASPGFAYQSYGVHALDYLLKPVSAKLLYPILDRLFQQEQKLQEGFNVKCGPLLVRIPFSQLVYVEVLHKHLYFNLFDGTIREVAGALKDYEDLLLSRPEFMHVHRSYIVNMLLIKELSPSSICTFSGKEIPVSRLLYPSLQKNYMQLLFDPKTYG